MPNNHKPVDEIRLSWDAEAAFKKIDTKYLWESSERRSYMEKAPYTPPPNVAAWLQAQADKPKAGRDIESLMRYHEAHKKGRTDDTVLEEKFGAAGTRAEKGSEVGLQSTRSPAAPTPPQPADGSTPLIGMYGVERLWFGGMEYLAHNRAAPCRREAAMRWWQNTRTPTIPEMYSWLEQNGHKDVAAQLRGKDEFEPVGTMPIVGDKGKYHPSHWPEGDTCDIEVFSDFDPRDGYMAVRCEAAANKQILMTRHEFMDGTVRILKRPLAPRDDVATGGGRVYLEEKWWYRVRIGERVWFKRHPDNSTPMFEHGWHEQHYGGGMEPANADECIRTRGGTELFGPERDAISAECRKAMGLDTSTPAKDT